MLVGADSGGERAAAMYSLIDTARLSGLDLDAYLAHVLDHIADHQANRVDELLPWNVAPSLPSTVRFERLFNCRHPTISSVVARQLPKPPRGISH